MDSFFESLWDKGIYMEKSKIKATSLVALIQDHLLLWFAGFII